MIRTVFKNELLTTFILYVAVQSYVFGCSLAIDDGLIDDVSISQHPTSKSCSSLIREGRPQEPTISFDLASSLDGRLRISVLSPMFSNHIPLMVGILLHRAVSLKRIDLVKDLLRIGGDLDVSNSYGETPLYRALEADFEEAVRLLTECGADVDFRSANGTLLHLAVTNRSKPMVEKLLRLGAEVEAESDQGYTPLFVAVRLNEMDLAKYLIGRGADVNHQTSDGRSLLHIAVFERDATTCTDLIALGAIRDTVDSHGHTPLYTAVKLNYSEIVSLLVQKGANVDFASPDGVSLLHLAVSEGNAYVVQKLIDFGANASAEDSNGLLPVHWAVERENIEILLMLLRLHDPNQRLRHSGDYLLHFAVRRGSVASTVLLLEIEDWHVQNKKGLTPYALAVSLNRTDIIKLFQNTKEQAQLNLTYNIKVNKRSYTPLQMAILDRDLNAAQNLIRYGASFSTNDNGSAPLWSVVESNSSAMIDLLLKNCSCLTKIDVDISYALLKQAIRNKCVACVDSLLGSGMFAFSGPSSNGSIDANEECKSSKPKTYLEILKNPKGVYKSEILSSPVVQKTNDCPDKRLDLMRYAITVGSNDVVEVLLKHGVVTKGTDSLDGTLITAVENRQPAILNTLIKQGANMTTQVKVYIRTPRGAFVKFWSLLHHAAYLNLVNEAAVLLDNGMDPNVRDSNLWTPLHVAAFGLNFEVCDLLVHRGAEIDVKTAKGFTPFYMAESKGALKMMNLLKVEK